MLGNVSSGSQKTSQITKAIDVATVFKLMKHFIRIITC